VSNVSVAQLKRIQPIHRVAFLQPPYSMLNRSIEAELLPYCEAEDIGIISYSPMQKGLLSGKVTAEWVAALPADDHRRNDPQFNEPLLAKNIALTKALAEVAHRYGRTSAELAIAWVLRQPRVTAAIVGARKPGQIKETVFGGKFVIKPDDLARIEEALAARG